MFARRQRDDPPQLLEGALHAHGPARTSTGSASARSPRCSASRTSSSWPRAAARRCSSASRASTKRPCASPASGRTGPSQYKRSMDMLHEHGISIWGSFVFGFDTDDPEVFDRTVEFGIEMKLTMALFAILTPYPGTQLYRRLLAEGRLTDERWWLRARSRRGLALLRAQAHDARGAARGLGARLDSASTRRARSCKRWTRPPARAGSRRSATCRSTSCRTGWRT